MVVGDDDARLRGARAYLDERPQLAAFVEVLGGVGGVTYGAIGIAWLRVRVSGEPAHTLRGRVPTVTRAIVRMLARLDELPLPTDDADEALTTLRCNMAHAGEVVNHAPPEGWFSVDLRSKDPATFARLRAEAERVVHDVAAEFGVTAAIAEYPGHAGSPPAMLPGAAAHPLARVAAEATRAVGVAPVMTPRGSSNLNVALERAIPAVLLAGERGDRRGQPDEYANIAPVFTGMQAIVRMAVALGEVGEEWPGW